MFYHTYPNFLQFIDTLKWLQTDMFYIKQCSTHLNNRTTSQINKEQFLKQAIEEYQPKQIE